MRLSPPFMTLELSPQEAARYEAMKANPDWYLPPSRTWVPPGQKRSGIPLTEVEILLVLEVISSQPRTARELAAAISRSDNAARGRLRHVESKGWARSRQRVAPNRPLEWSLTAAGRKKLREGSSGECVRPTPGA